MRMWNPDGTKDMCGNGLRCIALLAYRRGYTRSEFTVQTLAGLRRATIHEEELVRVGMGEPVFQPELIPTTVTEPIEYSLPIADVVLSTCHNDFNRLDAHRHLCG
jgi:diaminopimelate epimerase